MSCITLIPYEYLSLVSDSGKVAAPLIRFEHWAHLRSFGCRVWDYNRFVHSCPSQRKYLMRGNLGFNSQLPLLPRLSADVWSRPLCLFFQ